MFILSLFITCGGFLFRGRLEYTKRGSNDLMIGLKGLYHYGVLAELGIMLVLNTPKVMMSELGFGRMVVPIGIMEEQKLGDHGGMYVGLLQNWKQYILVVE